MKHWKAYIKVTEPTGELKQYIDTLAARTQFEAVNRFRQNYGPNSIIGWIKETKLYGLQSVGY